MLYCGLCLKFTFTLKEVPITNQQLYTNHLWGSLSNKCRYLEGTLSLKKAILTKTNRLLWESVTLATIFSIKLRSLGCGIKICLSPKSDQREIFYSKYSSLSRVCDCFLALIDFSSRVIFIDYFWSSCQNVKKQQSFIGLLSPGLSPGLIKTILFSPEN